MGQLIEFPVTRTLQPSRVKLVEGEMSETAEIILFSGVRYSALEETAKKPQRRQSGTRRKTKQ